jgi:hypothetical protein
VNRIALRTVSRQLFLNQAITLSGQWFAAMHISSGTMKEFLHAESGHSRSKEDSSQEIGLKDNCRRNEQTSFWSGLVQSVQRREACDHQAFPELSLELQTARDRALPVGR